jgi:hypothetical protein
MIYLKYLFSREQQNLFNLINHLFEAGSAFSSQLNTNDLLACSNPEFLCQAVSIQSYVKQNIPMYTPCTPQSGSQLIASNLAYKFYESYWNIEQFFLSNANTQGYLSSDYLEFSKRQTNTCMIEERENPCAVTFCKLYGPIMYKVFLSAADKGLGLDTSKKPYIKQVYDEFINALPDPYEKNFYANPELI